MNHPNTKNDELNQIARSSISMIARQIFSVLLFLTATTLLLSHVDAAEYATYITYFNTAMLIGSLAGLGTYPSIMYYLARHPEELRNVFLFFIISLMIGIAIILISTAALRMLEKNEVAFRPLLLLTISILPGLMLPSFAMARGDVTIFNLFEIVVPLAFLAGILILEPTTGRTIANILALAFLLKIIAYVFYLFPKLYTAAPRTSGIASFFVYSLPATITSLLYVTTFRSSFFFLQAVLPQPLFHLCAAAWSLLERMQALFTAINLQSFRFIATNKLTRHQHVLLIVGAAAVSLFASIALIGGSWFLERFSFIDNSYNGLHLALLLMAPVFVIWGVRTVLQNQLVATKNFKPIIKNLLCGLAGLSLLWGIQQLIPYGSLWLAAGMATIFIALLAHFLSISLSFRDNTEKEI